MGSKVYYKDQVIASSEATMISNAGDANKPVYFKDGKPVPISYTIEKSVPSDAKFTDTTYQNATTSAGGLMSASDKSKLNGIATGATASKSQTITLSSSGWSSKSQTVSASYVTSSNIVIVAPSPSYTKAYSDSQIICTSQSSGKLTFTCQTVPTSNISVNVVVV